MPPSVSVPAPIVADPTISALGPAQTPQEIAAASGYSNGLTPPDNSNAADYAAGGKYNPTPSNSSGVVQGNAPAGSMLSANGNYVDSAGNQYAKPPASSAATLTADTTTPSDTTTSAPATISSTTAKDNLGTIKTNLSTLDQNAADQKAAIAAVGKAFTPPVDTSKSTDTTGTTSDAAINKILASLDSNLSGTQTTANANQSTLDKQIADTQAQEMQAANDVATQLASIQNGTYPLSPAEQEQIDAVMASYQAVLQGQARANAGALGQVKQLMATLGIQSSAPMESIGLIQATISTGVQKIADITGKMNAAVGKLRAALQTQNFNQIQGAWKDMSKTFSDRLSSISKLQTAVATQAKDAQTAALNYAKTSITSIVNSDKVDMTQKKNAVDAAYKAGMLSAREYADATARMRLNSKGTGITKGTPQEINFITQQIHKSMGEAVQGNSTDPNHPQYPATGDHYVNPNIYQGYFDWWMSKGYTANSFFSNFPIKLVNPANTWLVPYLKGKLPAGSTIG